MENNRATLNAKNKTISFKFKDEDFTVDLTEGDLHDSWNGITTSDGKVWDFNFGWQQECSPALTLYAVDEENTTDFFDEYQIEIGLVIGTMADYFNLEFDGSLDCVFILFSAEKVKKLTSTLLNMLSDNKQDTDYIICIDSNGATKTLY